MRQSRAGGGGRYRLSRRTTVNIMLYVGVLAMAMVTYYDYRDRNAAQPAALAFDPGAVLAINVLRPGHQTIALDKTSDGWTITAPVNRAAISQRVDALLSIASLDAGSGYDVRELDLAELGLTTPRASIGLFTRERVIQVLLGGKGPNDERRYLQIDQRVWLADDVFLPLVTGGLNALANLGLLPAGNKLTGVVSPFIGATNSGEVLDKWRQGNAAAIAPIAGLGLTQAGYVTLEFADGNVQPLKMARAGREIALVPEGGDYGLLITESQAVALGLVGR